MIAWYTKMATQLLKKGDSAESVYGTYDGLTLRDAHDLRVVRALEESSGNISHAAVELDVDRRSLQRKIDRIKKRSARS